MIKKWFGKKKEKPPIDTTKNTSQDWLPIQDVHNSMIHRKDGYLLAAIMVSPVNIHLLTDVEKGRLIKSLEEVLNGIDDPFQIISIARPVDLDAYISELNSMKSDAQDQIKQRLLAGYMNHAAQMATSGEALERHFYILLDQAPSKNQQIDISTLMTRSKELATSLSGSGLSAHVCNDVELRDLLFIFTNPNQAAYERAPANSIQFPTVSTVSYGQEG